MSPRVFALIIPVMRRYLQSEKSIPLLLAAMSVLGYGLLLGTAGFHWDDWGFAWAAKFLGPAQFLPSFSGYRPFLGPIFFITTSLIPPVPLYWQIFALLIRFCIGLSAWWALKSIWPDRPRLALATSLLVLMFPGYSQHWVALTHINQELIPFISYLLSLGVSAHAIRRRSLWLTLLALLLQFWGLFPTEYFWGMELLRPLLLWSMVEQGHFWDRLRQAFVRWLPYLLVWLANCAWLIYLYSSEAYISYGIHAGQGFDLLGWLSGLLEAVYKTGLLAWVQVLALAGAGLPGPTALLTFALILVSFVVLLWYLTHTQQQDHPNHIAGTLILAGLAGILFGRIPSLAAGLPLTLQSVFDRFTISMALGASLLAAGCIEWAAGRHIRTKWVLVSLLVALATGQQFYNANLFRRDWARQQEIYWQFAWRMPALEPNTLLLTSVIPDMPLETDLSFTAPINWIYAPEYAGGDLPYSLLYTEARLGGGAIPELEPNLEINLPFRTVTFRGSTEAALVFLIPEQGCLRVLDPARMDQVTYEKESGFLTEAIEFSDPRRILVEAAALQPPRPPFEGEPAHTWCYYYEKAELARQSEDWQRILELEAEARGQGYGPRDPLEWLPFIEARAQSGDFEEAARMSKAAVKESARARKGLCNLWEGMSDNSGASAILAQIQDELDCTP